MNDQQTINMNSHHKNFKFAVPSMQNGANLLLFFSLPVLVSLSAACGFSEQSVFLARRAYVSDRHAVFSYASKLFHHYNRLFVWLNGNYTLDLRYFLFLFLLFKVHRCLIFNLFLSCTHKS